MFFQTNHVFNTVQPYDHLNNELDRTEWLLAAIYRRDGDDLCNSGLTCEDLEERWEESDQRDGGQTDHYAGVGTNVTCNLTALTYCWLRLKLIRLSILLPKAMQERPLGAAPGLHCRGSSRPITPRLVLGVQLPTREPERRMASRCRLRVTKVRSTIVQLGCQTNLVYMAHAVPASRGTRTTASQLPFGQAMRVVGNQADGNGDGDSDDEVPSTRLASKKPAKAPAWGSQVTEFRVTPVPQPKPRGTFRPPVLQSALRLSGQPSHPASKLPNATPQRPPRDPAAASCPSHANPNASASPRASVPARNPGYVRASSTPNRSSRPPVTHRRPSLVPRHGTMPVADESDEAAHVPVPPEGDDDDTDLDEPRDGFRDGRLGGNDQSKFVIFCRTSVHD